jgi:hypothetical protein
MTEQRHGRYYAQELTIDPAGDIREQIQDALAPASAWSGISSVSRMCYRNEE